MKPLMPALYRRLGQGATRLHISLGWYMQLARSDCGAAVDGAFAAREVDASELDDVLGEAGLLVQRASCVARAPWRAFIVTADSRPIHHAFVTFERTTPRLFKLYTAPGYRGRGAFQRAMTVIRKSLLAGGYTALESSCSAANEASVRAHRSAGFELVSRRYHPYLLGVALRPWLRRLPRLGRRRT